MLDDGPGINISVTDLVNQLSALCPAHGIDLAGAVALPCPLPLAARFDTWLREGRHGDLDYMNRDPEGRLQPDLKNPGAHTLLVFAQGYTRGWPAGDPDPAAGGPGNGPVPWTNRVARYARGRDYHDIFLKDIKGVLRGLAEQWPDIRAHASCDTGPYLEREYAWLAGLGFLGKNTCLIHEKLGSGFFLGVALTNLKVSGLPAAGVPRTEPLYAVQARRHKRPAMASLSACGRCTRCIDACPTGALLEGGGMDAGACISTWTIERQGDVPCGRETEVGGILFGCDICQAVCPWNNKAAGADLPAPAPGYATLPEHAEVALADLAAISEDEFRQRFRRTPLWRCHPAGMRRNARRIVESQDVTK